MKEAIVITKHEGYQSGEGITAFYREDGKIVYEDIGAWDPDSDKPYFFVAEFSIEEYKRGVQELREKGRCVMEGTRTLEMQKVKENKLWLHLSGSMHGSSTTVDWDIDKSVLSEKNDKLGGK